MLPLTPLVWACTVAALSLGAGIFAETLFNRKLRR